MSILKLGVIGTSKKADERRVSIHPEHLSRLPENLRRQLIFETGYGERFGMSDLDLAQQAGGIASRDELLETMDITVIAKPVQVDFEHEDLDNWVKELIGKGIDFIQAPQNEMYLWREAVLEDPSGNKVKLYWAGENRLNPPWRVDIHPK